MTFDEWMMQLEEIGHTTTEDAARLTWKAATLAEREACAKVCESEHVGESVDDVTDNEIDCAYNMALRHSAKSIRERSK